MTTDRSRGRGVGTIEVKTTSERKQVYELSLDDLDRAAVWEFALDEEGEEGQDEATVKPRPLVGALDPDGGMFVVRARFRFADGTMMNGYITPPAQGDLSMSTLQPVVVTACGQVPFWCGSIAPTDEQAQVAIGG